MLVLDHPIKSFSGHTGTTVYLLNDARFRRCGRVSIPGFGRTILRVRAWHVRGIQWHPCTSLRRGKRTKKKHEEVRREVS